MEVELGLKITRTRDDVSSSVDFHFSKDPFGPLWLTRETDSMFVLIIHLRGFKKEGIGIDINKEGNRITINGRKPVQEMVLIRWMAWKKEVELRAFRKVFRIPNIVDLDKIKARFNEEDGVLTIKMPKNVKGTSRFKIEEEEAEERVDLEGPSEIERKAEADEQNKEVEEKEEVEEEKTERKEPEQHQEKSEEKIEEITSWKEREIQVLGDYKESLEKDVKKKDKIGEAIGERLVKQEEITNEEDEEEERKGGETVEIEVNIEEQELGEPERHKEEGEIREFSEKRTRREENEEEKQEPDKHKRYKEREKILSEMEGKPEEDNYQRRQKIEAQELDESERYGAQEKIRELIKEEEEEEEVVGVEIKSKDDIIKQMQELEEQESDESSKTSAEEESNIQERMERKTYHTKEETKEEDKIEKTIITTEDDSTEEFIETKTQEQCQPKRHGEQDKIQELVEAKASDHKDKPEIIEMEERNGEDTTTKTSMIEGQEPDEPERHKKQEDIQELFEKQTPRKEEKAEEIDTTVTSKDIGIRKIQETEKQEPDEHKKCKERETTLLETEAKATDDSSQKVQKIEAQELDESKRHEVQEKIHELVKEVSDRKDDKEEAVVGMEKKTKDDILTNMQEFEKQDSDESPKPSKEESNIQEPIEGKTYHHKEETEEENKIAKTMTTTVDDSSETFQPKKPREQDKIQKLAKAKTSDKKEEQEIIKIEENIGDDSTKKTHMIEGQGLGESERHEKQEAIQELLQKQTEEEREEKITTMETKNKDINLTKIQDAEQLEPDEHKRYKEREKILSKTEAQDENDSSQRSQKIESRELDESERHGIQEKIHELAKQEVRDYEEEKEEAVISHIQEPIKRKTDHRTEETKEGDKIEKTMITTQDDSSNEFQESKKQELYQPKRPREQDKIQELVEAKTIDHKGKREIVETEEKIGDDSTKKIPRIEGQEVDESGRHKKQDTIEGLLEKQTPRKEEKEEEIATRETKSKGISLRTIEETEKQEQDEHKRYKEQEKILPEMETGAKDDGSRSEKIEARKVEKPEQQGVQDKIHELVKEEARGQEEEEEAVVGLEIKTKDDILKKKQEIEEQESDESSKISEEEESNIQEPMVRKTYHQEEETKGNDKIAKTITTVEDNISKQFQETTKQELYQPKKPREQDKTQELVKAKTSDHDEEREIVEIKEKIGEDTTKKISTIDGQELDESERHKKQDPMQELLENQTTRREEKEAEIVKAVTKSKDISLRKVQETEQQEPDEDKEREKILSKMETKVEDDSLQRSQKVEAREQDESHRHRVEEPIHEQESDESSKTSKEESNIQESMERKTYHHKEETKKETHMIEGQELSESGRHKKQEEIQELLEKQTTKKEEKEEGITRTETKSTDVNSRKIQDVEQQEPYEQKRYKEREKVLSEMKMETKVEDDSSQRKQKIEQRELDESKRQGAQEKICELAKKEVRDREEDKEEAVVGLEIKTKDDTLEKTQEIEEHESGEMMRSKEESNIQDPMERKTHYHKEETKEEDKMAQTMIATEDDSSKKFQEQYRPKRLKEQDKKWELVKAKASDHKEEREIVEIEEKIEDDSTQKTPQIEGQDQDKSERHTRIDKIQELLEKQAPRKEEEEEEISSMEKKSQDMHQRKVQETGKQELDDHKIYKEQEKIFPEMETKVEDDSPQRSQKIEAREVQESERYVVQDKIQDFVKVANDRKEEKEEAVVGMEIKTQDDILEKMQEFEVQESDESSKTSKEENTQEPMKRKTYHQEEERKEDDKMEKTTITTEDDSSKEIQKPKKQELYQPKRAREQDKIQKLAEAKTSDHKEERESIEIEETIGDDSTKKIPKIEGQELDESERHKKQDDIQELFKKQTTRKEEEIEEIATTKTKHRDISLRKVQETEQQEADGHMTHKKRENIVSLMETKAKDDSPQRRRKIEALELDESERHGTKYKIHELIKEEVREREEGKEGANAGMEIKTKDGILAEMQEFEEQESNESSKRTKEECEIQKPIERKTYHQKEETKDDGKIPKTMITIEDDSSKEFQEPKRQEPNQAKRGGEQDKIQELVEAKTSDHKKEQEINEIEETFGDDGTKKIPKIEGQELDESERHKKEDEIQELFKKQRTQKEEKDVEFTTKTKHKDISLRKVQEIEQKEPDEHKIYEEREKILSEAETKVELDSSQPQQKIEARELDETDRHGVQDKIHELVKEEARDQEEEKEEADAGTEIKTTHTILKKMQEFEEQESDESSKTSKEESNIEEPMEKKTCYQEEETKEDEKIAKTMIITEKDSSNQFQELYQPKRSRVQDKIQELVEVKTSEQKEQREIVEIVEKIGDVITKKIPMIEGQEQDESERLKKQDKIQELLEKQTARKEEKEEEIVATKRKIKDTSLRKVQEKEQQEPYEYNIYKEREKTLSKKETTVEYDVTQRRQKIEPRELDETERHGAKDMFHELVKEERWDHKEDKEEAIAGMEIKSKDDILQKMQELEERQTNESSKTSKEESNIEESMERKTYHQEDETKEDDQIAKTIITTEDDSSKQVQQPDKQEQYQPKRSREQDKIKEFVEGKTSDHKEGCEFVKVEEKQGIDTTKKVQMSQRQELDVSERQKKQDKIQEQVGKQAQEGQEEEESAKVKIKIGDVSIRKIKENREQELEVVQKSHGEEENIQASAEMNISEVEPKDDYDTRKVQQIKNIEGKFDYDRIKHIHDNEEQETDGPSRHNKQDNIQKLLEKQTTPERQDEKEITMVEDKNRDISLRKLQEVKKQKPKDEQRSHVEEENFYKLEEDKISEAEANIVDGSWGKVQRTEDQELGQLERPGVQDTMHGLIEEEVSDREEEKDDTNEIKKKAKYHILEEIQELEEKHLDQPMGFKEESKTQDLILGKTYDQEQEEKGKDKTAKTMTTTGGDSSRKVQGIKKQESYSPKKTKGQDKIEESGKSNDNKEEVEGGKIVETNAKIEDDSTKNIHEIEEQERDKPNKQWRQEKIQEVKEKKTSQEKHKEKEIVKVETKSEDISLRKLREIYEQKSKDGEKRHEEHKNIQESLKEETPVAETKTEDEKQELHKPERHGKEDKMHERVEDEASDHEKEKESKIAEDILRIIQDNEKRKPNEPEIDKEESKIQESTERTTHGQEKGKQEAKFGEIKKKSLDAGLNISEEIVKVSTEMREAMKQREEKPQEKGTTRKEEEITKDDNSGKIQDTEAQNLNQLDRQETKRDNVENPKGDVIIDGEDHKEKEYTEVVTEDEDETSRKVEKFEERKKQEIIRQLIEEEISDRGKKDMDDNGRIAETGEHDLYEQVLIEKEMKKTKGEGEGEEEEDNKIVETTTEVEDHILKKIAANDDDELDEKERRVQEATIMQRPAENIVSGHKEKIEEKEQVVETETQTGDHKLEEIQKITEQEFNDSEKHKKQKSILKVKEEEIKDMINEKGQEIEEVQARIRGDGPRKVQKIVEEEEEDDDDQSEKSKEQNKTQELVEEKMSNQEEEEEDKMENITEMETKADNSSKRVQMIETQESNEPEQSKEQNLICKLVEAEKSDNEGKGIQETNTKIENHISREVHGTGEQEISEPEKVKTLVEEKASEHKEEDQCKTKYEDDSLPKIQDTNKRESMGPKSHMQCDKIQELVGKDKKEEEKEQQQQPEEEEEEEEEELEVEFEEEEEEEELKVEFEEEEEEWDAEVIQESDLGKIRRRIKVGFGLAAGSTMFVSLIVIVIRIIRSKRKKKSFML